MGFFSKKPEFNPVLEELNGWSSNQRMSFMTFLLTITLSSKGNKTKEFEMLTKFGRLLNLPRDRCVNYLQENGADKIYSDLKGLHTHQKDFLITCIWDLVNLNGHMDIDEMTQASIMLEKIGIDEEKFTTTIKKVKAIMNNL